MSDRLHPEKPLVIAIDGPAASGKSSTAAWVANVLHLRHLDSGALYRAVTAARLREEENPGERWSEQSLAAAARRCALVPSGTAFIPVIDDRDASIEIRSEEVTRRVSTVAKVSAIREFVNEQIRALASEFDAVVDGRDIGTAVFPGAALKIFLVADSWERARRRLLQRLKRAPTDDEIAEETEHLVQRDARDATQSVPAKDAILIDTTHLTQQEQVERIVALAKAVSVRRNAVLD